MVKRNHRGFFRLRSVNLRRNLVTDLFFEFFEFCLEFGEFVFFVECPLGQFFEYRYFSLGFIVFFCIFLLLAW